MPLTEKLWSVDGLASYLGCPVPLFMCGHRVALDLVACALAATFAFVQPMSRSGSKRRSGSTGARTPPRRRADQLGTDNRRRESLQDNGLMHPAAIGPVRRQSRTARCPLPTGPGTS